MNAPDDLWKKFCDQRMTLIIEHFKQAASRHADLAGRKQNSDLAIKFSQKLERVSNIDELRALIADDIVGSSSAAVCVSYIMALNQPPETLANIINKNPFSLLAVVIIAFARSEMIKTDLRKSRN